MNVQRICGTALDSSRFGLCREQLPQHFWRTIRFVTFEKIEIVLLGTAILSGVHCVLHRLLTQSLLHTKSEMLVSHVDHFKSVNLFDL